MPDVSLESLSGAVLAGGEGRRMGGVDKGLVDLRGRPLVAWTLDALRPQVATVLINANRSLDQYREFGWPVVVDAGDGFRGPLAGMLAVLTAARTEFVLTVPCDAPLVPPDLSLRLGKALIDADAEISVAVAGAHVQPLHALMRRSVRHGLAEAIAAGARGVMQWQATLSCVQVACDDVADAFFNINTSGQRDELVRSLAGEVS